MNNDARFGTTAEELAEAFSQPATKNEKEAKEYIESFKKPRHFKYFRFSDGIFMENKAPYHLLDRNAASMGRIAARIDKVDGFADGIMRWIAKDPKGITLLSWTEEEMEERLSSVMQADTIEELCDQFIIVGGKYKYRDIFKKMSDRGWNNLNLKAFSVYGAIWTDKGLIYVAKMNEKGEFELL